MEGVNKIVSLFLGLVVVIVLFAIVTGRINLSKRLPAFSFLKRLTPTVTPTKTNETLSNTSKNTVITLPPPPATSNLITTQAPEQRIPTIVRAPSYFAQQNNRSVQRIPSTGSPTLLFPIVFSLFASGIYLRKKG